MKLIPTTEAVGHILCHDITRIVVNETKERAFQKGHRIRSEDIPALLKLGKESLYVWEDTPGMLHENDAAQILYKICAGANMHPTEVKEGKIEVIADADGLLVVDKARLQSVNALGQMMIATALSHRPVKKGDKLAGTRIIPLVISQEHLDRAVKIGANQPLLQLLPYTPKKVGLVITGSEVFKGRIEDAFTPVLRRKLSEFPATEIGHQVCDDESEHITKAIKSLLDQGAELVLCTGGMSVDPDDRTPLAIRQTGARIVNYGSPVLPGSMCMLAYTEAGIPILGLPGCVMYERRTIFDLLLPRLMADVPVTSADIAALGHGGLCFQCATCIFPKCGFGSGY